MMSQQFRMNKSDYGLQGTGTFDEDINLTAKPSVTTSKQRFVCIVFAVVAAGILTIVSTAVICYYVVKLNTSEYLQMVSGFSELKGNVDKIQQTLKGQAQYSGLNSGLKENNHVEDNTVNNQHTEFQRYIDEINRTLDRIEKGSAQKSEFDEYIEEFEKKIERVGDITNQTVDKIERGVVQQSLEFVRNIENMNTSIGQIEQTILRQSEFLVFKEMINQTMDKIDMRTMKNSEFGEYIEQLNQTIEQFGKDAEEQSNISRGLRTDLQELNITFEDRHLSKKKEAIGFTVKFYTATKLFKMGDILTFNEITRNYRSEYDMRSGKFRCTQPGMYFFQFNLISNSREAAAFIVKDDEEIAYAYTSGDSNTRYDSGSASVVIKLNVNDSVWVKSHGNHNYDRHSAFIGMLIAI